MKPDYARIAELERDIYGQPVSRWPSAIHERIAELRDDAAEPAADSLEAFVADVLLFWLRPLPAELAGSRWAQVGRRVVQGLVAFSVLWVVLMCAGLVPWSG